MYTKKVHLHQIDPKTLCCKRLKQLFSFQPIGFTSGQIPAVDVLIANPDSLPIS